VAVRRTIEVAVFAGGAGAVALLCWRFGFANVSAAFAHFSPQYLVGYLAFGGAVRLGFGWRWHVVARRLGGSPGLGRLVAARIAGDAVSSLLPTGRISGDPLRIALVYEEGVGAARASASVALDRVMETIANTLCGIASVAVFSSAHTLGSSRQAAHTLIDTLLFLLAALAIPLEMLRRGVHLAAPIERVVRGPRFVRLQGCVRGLRGIEDQLIQFLQCHPGTMVWGILGSLCIEALQILEYHFLLATFGISLDFPTLLMAMVATGLARVVPTPAGLGALEAGQVTVLALASNQPDLGFVVGIVMRLHQTLWVATGLLVLAVHGVSLRRLRLLAAVEKAAA
jgi:uncharacterized protein (TIRG00374 family)